jgi:hypothetical protein
MDNVRILQNEKTDKVIKQNENYLEKITTKDCSKPLNFEKHQEKFIFNTVSDSQYSSCIQNAINLDHSPIN